MGGGAVLMEEVSEPRAVVAALAGELEACVREEKLIW